MMNRKTKLLTTTAMLCAFAYAAALGRVPLVLFLKYEPKDSILAISGLIFGPLTAFSVAFIVSFLEMLTISETGGLGFLMNVISSCSFACTATLVCKKRNRLSNVVIGLLCGWGCMVLVMLLWNFFLTPIYMGLPRQAVAKLLLPVFLPFNLMKGGLNTAITIALYKPVLAAFSRAHLIDANPTKPAVK